ncbi:MAG: hypothetical protein AAF587_43390 [Bacteroidota bacterium]
MNIPQEVYQEIEAIIYSEKSVVGIDAKKTHILILYQLMQLEKRMEKMEQTLRHLQEQSSQ